MPSRIYTDLTDLRRVRLGTSEGVPSRSWYKLREASIDDEDDRSRVQGLGFKVLAQLTPPECEPTPPSHVPVRSCVWALHDEDPPHNRNTVKGEIGQEAFLSCFRVRGLIV